MKSDPTPEEMGSISEAGRLAGFLPYLRLEVERMVRVLEMRIFQQVQDGTLTPDLAQAAWMERFAYHRLLSRFDQRVRAGTSVASRVNLDINPPDRHM